jgi:phage terminase Nu1 subunit (DNA packaging protein)
MDFSWTSQHTIEILECDWDWMVNDYSNRVAMRWYEDNETDLMAYDTVDDYLAWALDGADYETIPIAIAQQIADELKRRVGI